MAPTQAGMARFQGTLFPPRKNLLFVRHLHFFQFSIKNWNFSAKMSVVKSGRGDKIFEVASLPPPPRRKSLENIDPLSSHTDSF